MSVARFFSRNFHERDRLLLGRRRDEDDELVAPYSGPRGRPPGGLVAISANFLNDDVSGMVNAYVSLILLNSSISNMKRAQGLPIVPRASDLAFGTALLGNRGGSLPR